VGAPSWLLSSRLAVHGSGRSFHRPAVTVEVGRGGGRMAPPLDALAAEAVRAAARAPSPTTRDAADDPGGKALPLGGRVASGGRGGRSSRLPVLSGGGRFAAVLRRSWRPLVHAVRCSDPEAADRVPLPIDVQEPIPRAEFGRGLQYRDVGALMQLERRRATASQSGSKLASRLTQGEAVGRAQELLPSLGASRGRIRPKNVGAHRREDQSDQSQRSDDRRLGQGCTSRRS
jgi:hypothetical protein